MAPDTEPTDEELAVVMREARDEALRKRAIGDEALAKKLRDALDAALATRAQRLKGRGVASDVVEHVNRGG